MKKAIITLATKHYKDSWHRYCSTNWRRWADLNDYQLNCFTEHFDSSERANKRSHAWQKLLAMTDEKFSDYDYCLWLDADIFINPTTPDPLNLLDINKIAVTIETGSPYSDELIEVKRSWNESFQELNNGKSWKEKSYFHGWGFKGELRPLFNTGVIGYSPKKHNTFIRDIYYKWEESTKDTLWGEMIPFNLAVQSTNWQILPRQYNRLLYPFTRTWHKFNNKYEAVNKIGLSKLCRTDEDFILQIFKDTYFLHLAGASQERFSKYADIINR